MKYLEIKTFNYKTDVLNMKDNLESQIEEIVEYFDIEEFGDKINLIIFNNLNDFRKEIYKMTGIIPEPWVCGKTITKDDNRYIYSLTIDQLRKTKNHENYNIEDLQKLILHEFVHACQSIVSSKNKLPLWLCEGQAIYLAKQKFLISFNASYEEMVNGNISYNNYLSMFNYVLKTYGKNYTMNLIRNKELRDNDGPRLYHEATLYYKNYFKSIKIL